jgi:hypothetical protein
VRAIRHSRKTLGQKELSTTTALQRLHRLLARDGQAAQETRPRPPENEPELEA